MQVPPITPPTKRPTASQMLRLDPVTESDTEALIGFFATTFTASDGAGEGAMVGGLVGDLLRHTPPADRQVFCTFAAGAPLACAIFTPLIYEEDPQRVVLLSPMAVTPARQRQGLGQALLTHALGALRQEGVDVAITYGDPAFYGRLGFAAVTEAQARAPLPLSLPHGWLGQRLHGGGLPSLRGPCRCVPALNRPDLW